MSSGCPIAGSPRIMPLITLSVLCVLLLAAGCTQPSSPPATPIPAPPATNPEPAVTSLTVPFPPIPVPSANGVNLAYELEIATIAGAPIVPEKIEVLDPATGKILFSAAGNQLAGLYHPAADPPPTAAELRNGTAKLLIPRISLWITVSPENVPDQLVHRLTLNRSASALPPVTITSNATVVRKDLAPVVIGSPMRGPGWLALETTAPTTHHFLGQIAVGGIPRVPQRFAQDWIYVDPVTGNAVNGNATLASNYLGYGKEIYAVANGTVVDVLDGIPDNELIYSPPPINFTALAGNSVIVDIGDKKYACYAHFIPGSLTVKKGDQVREGQLLGLMGNSGNSDLPHLHFQVVTDNPTFLASEGYPHVYRSFEAIGRMNWTLVEQKTSDPGYSLDRLWAEFADLVVFSPQPVAQEKRLPENYVLVRLI